MAVLSLPWCSRVLQNRGRVVAAVSIACERLRTRSGIYDASSVGKKRDHSIGRVVVAGDIVS